jgi:hypothetical protein
MQLPGQIPTHATCQCHERGKYLIEKKPLAVAANRPGRESPGPESAEAQFHQARRGFSALGVDYPAVGTNARMQLRPGMAPGSQLGQRCSAASMFSVSTFGEIGL